MHRHGDGVVFKSMPEKNTEWNPLVPNRIITYTVHQRVRLLFIEVLITLFTEVSLTTLCDYYRKVTHASCYCIMITYYYAYKGLHSVDVYSNNYLYTVQRLILWIYNYYCMYNACVYYVHISSQ